jgi:hypothetical protein
MTGSLSGDNRVRAEASSASSVPLLRPETP